MYLRVILLAFALGGTVNAQDLAVQDGRDLFMTHCWQCHGQDAMGNGPMAEMFAITTPDLTRLAARNNGVFPLMAVARQIDGRDAVLAHGGEMPIFGPFLETDISVALRLPSGQPMMTGLPLANVIVYLESLQEE
ncbi:c-type cytochrome [Tabrizicola sp. WMC-M-20]|nr:c-type cytochrome [Tabrizicola sp. WMC-M-20]